MHDLNMMRGRRTLTAVLAALALRWSPLAAAQRSAPDIALRTADGTEVHLADLKGKIVLVDFWASWCVPCKTSFPALDALYREYRTRDVEVLAVNVDERRRDADAFLAVRPHELPVFFDSKGASAEAFGVRGMPSSFVIDRDGMIRFTHLGYSTNVDASYRQELVQLLSERHQP
jgi:thiol-disulfide isomerase/thioredoxin